MQKSNTTKYLILSAVFIFASTKKVYAETEINLQSQETLQSEPQQQPPVIMINVRPTTHPPVTRSLELETTENLDQQETLLQGLLTNSESSENVPDENEIELHQEQSSNNRVSEQHNGTSKEPDLFIEGVADTLTVETVSMPETEVVSNELSTITINQAASGQNAQTEIIVLPILTSEQQEQVINAVLNSLTPQEQVQFIEILEGNSLMAETSEKTSLEKILECFSSCRCLNFCLKLSLAILFWEVVQKLDIVENNKIFPKSAQELFKALTTVLFVDDIKDFVKEIKKAVEGECSLLYRNFYSK